GNTAPCELTLDAVLVVVLGLDGGGAERHRGMIGDVEELVALEVFGASGLSGVDRGHVDLGGHAGVEDALSRHDLPGYVGEGATGFRDTKVLDAVGDLGVCWVDCPATSDVARDLGRWRAHRCSFDVTVAID